MQTLGTDDHTISNRFVNLETFVCYICRFEGKHRCLKKKKQKKSEQEKKKTVRKNKKLSGVISRVQRKRKIFTSEKGQRKCVKDMTPSEHRKVKKTGSLTQQLTDKVK